MNHKQHVTRILVYGYLIRTALLVFAALVLGILSGSSFDGMLQTAAGLIVLSVISFAVSCLASPEDSRVTPSAGILYAVFDVIVFSFGSLVFAMIEMSKIQGGSGLALMFIPILGGLVILPFAIVLAVVTFIRIRREFQSQRY